MKTEFKYDKNLGICINRSEIEKGKFRQLSIMHEGVQNMVVECLNRYYDRIVAEAANKMIREADEYMGKHKIKFSTDGNRLFVEKDSKKRNSKGAK